MATSSEMASVVVASVVNAGGGRGAPLWMDDQSSTVYRLSMVVAFCRGLKGR